MKSINFIVLCLLQLCLLGSCKHMTTASSNSHGNNKTVYLPAVTKPYPASDKPNQQALQFAVPVDVLFTTGNSGIWSESQDYSTWRLEINADSATSLNFAFENVFLSKDAQLSILNAQGHAEGGVYTEKHNKKHRQLWTGQVGGSKAVIQLRVPTAQKQKVQFTLVKVNQGF